MEAACVLATAMYKLLTLGKLFTLSCASVSICKILTWLNSMCEYHCLNFVGFLVLVIRNMYEYNPVSKFIKLILMGN